MGMGGSSAVFFRRVLGIALESLFQSLAGLFLICSQLLTHFEASVMKTLYNCSYKYDRSLLPKRPEDDKLC